MNIRRTKKMSAGKSSTVYTWIRIVRLWQLDLGEGMHTPKSAMTLEDIREQ